MCVPELRVALADAFCFYFKAHSFHWNVTGPLFRELHELFGAIYEDAHGMVDDLAERIRILGEMAPSSLSEIEAASTIAPDDGTPDGVTMADRLSAANDILIASLTEAQSAASCGGEVGIVNFLQDRIDRQNKWNWMLRATAKPATPSERRYRSMLT